MKNVLKPLANSVLIPLGLAAASAADRGIHIKSLGSGTTTPLISNEEMKNIMKIVKSLGDSGVLIKDVTKTIGNKTKRQVNFLVCSSAR